MSMVNMKLIVGLGNPGKQYEMTRHNVGFLVVDAISKNEKFSLFTLDKKFNAEISKGNILTHPIILAKPLTYMNNSGLAVRAISDYFKIPPRDIMVIHDDLDLPLAKIRISQKSSSGGHKGVESIIRHLQTQDFARFRLGIAGEHAKDMNAEEYVLKNFSQEEYQKITSSLSLVIEAIESSVCLGIIEAMNEFN